MEHVLLPVADFLQELRFRRIQVTELERENSHLKLMLVERSADIRAKALQYKLRDDKDVKQSLDVKRTIEDYRARYQNYFEENLRYQKAISEKHEMLVQAEVEKEILKVKLEQADRKAKELYESALYTTDNLPALLSRQEKLIQGQKSLDEKYNELMKINENLESFVVKIVAEATEKWNSAVQMESECEQLRKKLCNCEARLLLMEKEKSSSGNSLSEVELLKARLNKAEELEVKLAQDLEKERQERLSVEKEFADALTRALRK